MKNYLIVGVAVTLFALCCTSITEAQWTPDPFCPFPSDHVTRYPYYGNCSLFWECYNGAKYVMVCPEGLEFNAPFQRCDAPEIAKCDPCKNASTTFNPNHTTPSHAPTNGTTTTTARPTTIKPGPHCPNNDTLIYYPYPGDCTKYWECFAGHAYLYDCPGGLWWHQEISECDYPGSYCDNSTTTPWTHAPTTDTTTWLPTRSTNIPTTGGNDPRCSQGGTSYWPEPGDCHKYVECINYVSYIVTCPTNLFFSDKVKQCVRVDESECCKVYECNPHVSYNTI